MVDDIHHHRDGGAHGHGDTAAVAVGHVLLGVVVGLTLQQALGHTSDME